MSRTTKNLSGVSAVCCDENLGRTHNPDELLSLDAGLRGVAAGWELESHPRGGCVGARDGGAVLGAASVHVGLYERIKSEAMAMLVAQHTRLPCFSFIS